MTGTATVHIVGAPRSGTSLVHKILCLHPSVSWISNIARRARWRPEANAANRLAARLPDRRRAVWFSGGENAYVYDRSRGIAERAFPMPVEAQPLFDALLGAPGTEPTAGQLRQLLETLDRTRRWAGGQVLVSKNVANNRRIGVLAGADASSLVIHVVRDGRAVARSLRRVDWWEESDLWWFGGTVADWASGGGDPWEACVRTWRAEVGALDVALARVPQHRLHIVRYESLVSDPAGTVERLLRFIGLAPDTAVNAEIAQLQFPDRDERWRAELDAGELAVVDAVAGRTLERLGYTA